jgi:DNA polymerase-4
VGAQRALGRGPTDPAALDAALLALVERVTGRMRRAGRLGRTVTLRLRFADFTRVTRSHTLGRATARTAVVLAAARALLAAAAPLIATRGITLIGVAVTNLDDARAVQLTLPFDRRPGTAPVERRPARAPPGPHPEDGPVEWRESSTGDTDDGSQLAALDAALDDVRDRFGTRALTRAVLLGRDPGLSVPLLPD